MSTGGVQRPEMARGLFSRHPQELGLQTRSQQRQVFGSCTGKNTEPVLRSGLQKNQVSHLPLDPIIQCAEHQAPELVLNPQTIPRVSEVWKRLLLPWFVSRKGIPKHLVDISKNLLFFYGFTNYQGKHCTRASGHGAPSTPVIPPGRG